MIPWGSTRIAMKPAVQSKSASVGVTPMEQFSNAVVIEVGAGEWLFNGNAQRVTMQQWPDVFDHNVFQSWPFQIGHGESC